jgi:type IV secretion system protein VirD4
MSATQNADLLRRSRNVLIFFLIVPLIIGIIATQFVAWRLNYHPSLGEPIYEHAYWPWRIIQWWQAPWEPQVDSSFQMVKFALFALIALGAMPLAKAGRKKPKPLPDIHGTARFRTEEEIRKSSLWPKGEDGIMVGGWQDRKGGLHYLTDSSEGHVLCLGPSRIGKTMSVLIPTLLTWPESLVVYDTKGELWKKTAGWRAREADNIVLRFAPAELENTVAWNPFSRVRSNTPFAFRDIANIVQQIADPSGKGFTDHWEPSAANLLNGIACYLDASERGCDLSALLSAIDSSADSEVLLKAMADSPITEVAEVGRGLLATATRERGSIISTARRLLMIYRDPVLRENVSHSDFFIEDLVNARKAVTLYIETRGEDELRLRYLVRLLFNLIVGQLISLEGPNRHKLILGIDEMPSLRRMEPLELFLSKGAGSAIRALLLAQDYQDIVAEYGERERITTNCAVQIAHAPNNVRTAEWLSSKTGQTTRVVEEVSESQQRGGQKSISRSYRSFGATLMTPDEVTRLRLPLRDEDDQIIGPGEMLIFQAGEHVIRGTQTLAFRDPEFRRRMAIPAPKTMRTR